MKQADWEVRSSSSGKQCHTHEGKRYEGTNGK